MTMRTLAVAGLIVLAAMSRLMPHPDNFAPITAMAVFGGIICLNRRNAVLAPLIALVLSDLAKEALYRHAASPDWGVYRDMWAVYGATALVAILSGIARGTRSPIIIGVMTLVGSCVFFVITNFGSWASYSFYPHTAAGLATSYIAGLPFFRTSLLGDVTFVTILFGAWALAERWVPALQPTPAVAKS